MSAFTARNPDNTTASPSQVGMAIAIGPQEFTAITVTR
jgi:hypothetical protein